MFKSLYVPCKQTQLPTKQLQYETWATHYGTSWLWQIHFFSTN